MKTLTGMLLLLSGTSAAVMPSFAGLGVNRDKIALKENQVNLGGNSDSISPKVDDSLKYPDYKIVDGSGPLPSRNQDSNIVDGSGPLISRNQDSNIVDGSGPLISSTGESKPSFGSEPEASEMCEFMGDHFYIYNCFLYACCKGMMIMEHLQAVGCQKKDYKCTT